MPIIIRTQNENTEHFTVVYIPLQALTQHVQQTCNKSHMHDFKFSSRYALKYAKILFYKYIQNTILSAPGTSHIGSTR